MDGRAGVSNYRVDIGSYHFSQKTECLKDEKLCFSAFFPCCSCGDLKHLFLECYSHNEVNHVFLVFFLFHFELLSCTNHSPPQSEPSEQVLDGACSHF